MSDSVSSVHTAADFLFKRDVNSAWETCMHKTGCKIGVIVGIAVGAFIIFSIIFCICRGITLCCCCCFLGQQDNVRNADIEAQRYYNNQPTMYYQR